MEETKNVLPGSSPEVVLPTPDESVKKVPEGYVPLSALEQERQWRKDWEAKAKLLESSINTPAEDSEDVWSDEGKNLKKHISTLEEQIASMREEGVLKELFAQYPVLKDKQEEFREYRAEYPRHKLENVAKLFLSEFGLLEPVPERKGLEKPSSSFQQPFTSKQSSEDIKRLREENPRMYQKMILEGKIKPEDIG